MVLGKLSHWAFKLLGRDGATGVKIKPRSDLKEIGTEYGGWIIPASLINAKSICYCVGCGEDISFDIGLINEFGCNVFAFDPTPKAIRHVKDRAGNNPRYHFSPTGLWEKEDILKFYAPKNPKHVSHSLLNLQKTDNYIEVNVRRLDDIMKNNSHTKMDLLKMDVEGAEYKIIQSIIEDNIYIKIICVEFDEYNQPLDHKYKKRIRDSIRDLIDFDYSLVHIKGNTNYTFVKNN